MIAGRGYAASETREVLLQAKVLTDEHTEVSQKCAILYGIWACYYVGGEVAMQQRAAAEFLAEAERVWRYGGDLSFPSHARHHL